MMHSLFKILEEKQIELPENIRELLTGCKGFRCYSTTGELADAKEFLKGNLLLAAESNDNQMVRLAQNEINFGQYIPISEVVANIEAVTAGDVQALARQLFAEGRFSLTLLGPLTELPSDFIGVRP